MELTAATLKQGMEKCVEFGTNSVRVKDEVILATPFSRDKVSLEDRLGVDICYARMSLKNVFYFCTMLPEVIVDWYTDEVMDFFPDEMLDKVKVTPLLDKKEAEAVFARSRLKQRSKCEWNDLLFVPRPLCKVEFDKDIDKSSAFIALNLFRMLHENADITLMMYFLHTQFPKMSLDELYYLAISNSGRSGHLIGGAFYIIPGEQEKILPQFNFKQFWQKALSEFATRPQNERHQHIDLFFYCEMHHPGATFFKYIAEDDKLTFLNALIIKQQGEAAP